jgi:hypothetical protein
VLQTSTKYKAKLQCQEHRVLDTRVPEGDIFYS